MTTLYEDARAAIDAAKNTELERHQAVMRALGAKEARLDRLEQLDKDGIGLAAVVRGREVTDIKRGSPDLSAWDGTTTRTVEGAE